MLDHLAEEPILLNKFVGGTNLLYPPPTHHDDLVVVSYGVESVGNGDHCGALELCVNAVLNKIVGFHVHVGGSFIKDQEFVFS